MKKIKIIGLLLIVLFVSIMSFNTNSYATHDTTGKWLGLYEKTNGRPTGYYITGTEKHSEVPVIKIVEYTSQEGTSPDQSKLTQAIYCLKDGVGFGSTGSDGQTIVKYSEYFDLKNPTEIEDGYKVNLPSGDNYNKLIWLLDNLCIPEEPESVNNLLTKANATELTESITDPAQLKDVLEVIQQSAIWYITNPNDDYQPSQTANFYVAPSSGGVKEPLSRKYSLDEAGNPITKIFKYLINGANDNGTYDYSKGAADVSPLTFDKSRATVTLSGSNYLVGPYKITKNTDYSNFTAKVYNDQSEIANVTLVDSEGTAITGVDTKTKLENSLGKDFYIQLPSTTSVTQVRIEGSCEVEKTKLEYWSTPLATVQSSQPVVIIKKEVTPSSFTDSKNIEKPNFDLALRKFITKIGTQDVTDRVPSITQEYLRALATGNASALDSGTTTRKTHPKDAKAVKTGDKVVYTIRVYNEGEIDGYAEEITDYLPDGLELVPTEESEINRQYRWVADENDNKIIRTDYLSRATGEQENLIKAFDKNPKNGQYEIFYKDVLVECRVVASTKSTDTHLKNVAEISEDYNSAQVEDRDSVPGDLTSDQKNNYAPGTSTQGKGYSDDDDFEDLVLPGSYFDVALRKFITSVNGVELKTNGVYDREPKVDVSPLLNGKTTASYAHPKSPVSVSAGDIVTYTIKVYNEGQVDGYVDEIVDHLPPELEFLPEDEINKKFLWTIDSSDRTQRTIRTTYLSKEHDEDNLLKGFDQTKTTLDSKEVQIRCKVSLTAPTLKKITNIAEITLSSNESQLTDRDNERSAVLPQDTNLPDYKGKDSNKDDLSDKNYHYEGQEDDDDFEKVILEKFDLALRKFITGVNDQNVTSRIPQVDPSKYGTIVDGKEITDMEYTHPKDPVRVAQTDIVTYTIRIYNEGTKDGYASEIKDDIPDGLEFVLENETNRKYRWVLYDKDGNETTDVKLAKTIRTDYLSKDNEEEDGEFLLKAFDPETMDTPDYRDVQVAFKVTEPNTSDRILTNHAEISKDTDKNGDEVDDIDSTPDEWIDGEDDQDVEHLYVKYFDLALRKWVSQVILIEDGVQKEMDTHHYAEQDPEPVVKVELNKNRIDNTIIKFRYQIRITNEGEIEGYCSEISDYIPDGLKFNQADNPKWKEANGKIVTDQLKDTLLQPGESVTVDVVLTWINSQDNLDLKVNVAEISKDDNKYGSADIDSTPNNRKEGEDDIDDAPVILTVVTGHAPKYIAITAGTIAIIAIGAIVIKKYVI